MKKLGLRMVAVLLAASCYGAGPRGNGPTKDAQEIRALEDRFVAAFKAKDVEAIMKGYAPGAQLTVFDMVPPRQYVGSDAYKKNFQQFFATFPGEVEQFELTDLDVTAEASAVQKAIAEDGNVDLGPYFDFWFADAIECGVTDPA